MSEANQEAYFKCGVKGCDFQHALARSVGVHRRIVHGIIGKSATSKNRYKQKEVAEKEIKSASKKKALYRAKVKAAKTKQSENIPHEIQEDEAIIKFAVGRIYQVLSDIASKSNYTTEQLTSRCLAYFNTPQVWE